MIDAILLAAGSSVRMGPQNKLLLPYSSSTIIRETTKKLAKANVNKLIIVLGYDHRRVKEATKSIDKVEYVYNTIHLHGQLSSLQSAMSLIDDRADAFMVCLADMPNISTADYNFLIDQFNHKTSNCTILRPYYKNQLGHPVIFDKKYKFDILKTSKEVSGKTIIENNQKQLLKVEVSSVNFFLDVDNPSDYNRLMMYNDTDN